MSSSQQKTFTKPTADDTADTVMMEAPDSPPDLPSSYSSPNQSFVLQSPTSQQSNSARTNGESNAKVNFGAPGSSWQTKKFLEEYEKADNALLDRQWDHSKYGDPLLEG